MAALPIDKTSLSYLVLISVVVISATVSLVASAEKPLHSEFVAENSSFGSALKEMLEGLKDKNFGLVLLGRVCFSISTTPQGFLLYLTQDLMPFHNSEMAVTILALSAQFVAVLITIPTGKLSDRYGRKIFVYIGTAFIIVTYELFVMTSNVYIYYALGVLMGVGLGMYTTVDMALAMDCLPKETQTVSVINSEEKDSHTTAGRNMALWGTSQSAGNLIGLYLLSPLLQFVGGTSEKDHYTRTGYVIIFSLGSLFAALSSVMVFFIKIKKTRGSG